MIRHDYQIKAQKSNIKFLLTISDKKHLINKVQRQRTKGLECQKIMYFNQQTEQKKIDIVKYQVQNIKNYIKKREDYPSNLQVDDQLHIQQKLQETKIAKPKRQTIQRRIIYLYSKYVQFPTLQVYYTKMNCNYQNNVNIKAQYIYFFQQFFELILKVGGIDYYFYTHKNIFIKPIDHSQGKQFKSRLLLNYTSFAGLNCFWQDEIVMKMSEFSEIYPLLPENLFIFDKSKNQLVNNYKNDKFLLDRIIKKKALAYLILCFILKKIPILCGNGITKEDRFINSQQINGFLSQLNTKYKILLQIQKQKIQQISIETGINLSQFFKIILLQDTYIQTTIKGQKQLQQLSWYKIQKLLFTNSQQSYIQKYKVNQIQYLQENDAYVSKMLNHLFKLQNNQKYYLLRKFVEKTNQEPVVTIIYILTKFRVNFHEVLKFSNINRYLADESTNFYDSNQIRLKLIALFSDQCKQNHASRNMRTNNRQYAKTPFNNQQSQQLKKQQIGQSKNNQQGKHFQKDDLAKELGTEEYLSNPFYKRNEQQTKNLWNLITNNDQNQQGQNEKYLSQEDNVMNLIRPGYVNKKKQNQKGQFIINYNFSHQYILLSQFTNAFWDYNS